MWSSFRGKIQSNNYQILQLLNFRAIQAELGVQLSAEEEKRGGEEKKKRQFQQAYCITYSKMDLR